MLALGHRGLPGGNAVENTIPAFRRALERGLDGVELDVQLSRDNEVVVFHDRDLRRLFGRYERVDSLTWRQLAALRLPGGAKIPRLTDIVDFWPTGSWLCIDLKGVCETLAVACVDILRGRPGVILSCKDPRPLLHARRAGSGYDHVLGLSAASTPFLHLHGASHFRFQGVDIDHRLATPAIVQRYHDEGLKVGVYTLQSATDVQRVRGMGVDRVITTVIPGPSLERMATA